MEVDPNTQLLIEQKIQDIQEQSDKKYAVKLVEQIVFGLIAAIAVAIVGLMVTKYL